MPPIELPPRALQLASDAADQLERWLALFEAILTEAESTGRPPELRDFVACLAALERTLKIANLARALQSEAADAAAPRLDQDTLRRLLQEED